MPHNRQQIKQQLDKEAETTAISLLGMVIGFFILIWAAYLSYQIAINLHTEHQGFAIIIGIPFNCVLYYLVYQCLQMRKGQFKTDINGDVDWVVGEKSILPNFIWQPIRFLATALFLMVLLWSILALRLDITCYSLIPIMWLYQKSIVKNANLRQDKFWKIINYLATIPKLLYLLLFILGLLFRYLV